MVQWLRLHAPNVWGTGLIPGRGIKIPHAVWPKSNNNEKKIKNKMMNYKSKQTKPKVCTICLICWSY